MPPGRPSSPKPPGVSWGDARFVLILSGVFDALRFFFLFLPFFAIKYATAEGGSVAGATTSVLAGGELFVLGIVLAIAVALLGWLTVLVVLAITNLRIFAVNASKITWLWGIGLWLSTLVMTYVLYRTEVKQDAAAMEKWRADNAGATRLERQREALQLAQARAAAVAQENATAMQEQEETTTESAAV